MSILYLETGSTDPCVNLAVEEHVLTRRAQGDWLMLWQNDNTVVIGPTSYARRPHNPQASITSFPPSAQKIKAPQKRCFNF